MDKIGWFVALGYLFVVFLGPFLITFALTALDGEPDIQLSVSIAAIFTAIYYFIIFYFVEDIEEDKNDKICF